MLVDMYVILKSYYITLLTNIFSYVGLQNISLRFIQIFQHPNHTALILGILLFIKFEEIIYHFRRPEGGGYHRSYIVDQLTSQSAELTG